jgi:hypothetical protein
MDSSTASLPVPESSEHPEPAGDAAEAQPIDSPEEDTSGRKPSRRLRPEALAALAARQREAQLQELYQRPVEELEPEELKRMKAAFFRR